MLTYNYLFFLILFTLTGCCYQNGNGRMQPYFPEKNQARGNAQAALTYLQQGYTDKSYDSLQLALKQSPNDPAILGIAGYYYEKTGNLPRANGYYAQATLVSPQSGIAKNNYGAFLCRNGYFEASIPLFKQAAAIQNTPIRYQALENAKYCSEKMQSGLGASPTYAYHTHTN
jgi:type IV pilus assembly protein PilF